MRSPRKRSSSIRRRPRATARPATRKAAPARKAVPHRRAPRDSSPASIERLLSRQRWDRISPLVRRVGANEDQTLARLRDFCARVLAWNRSVSNLISRNDEGRIVERHLVESLEHAEWLSASGCSSWIDLGSGAGFPAIPLAIVGVGARWTLVESRRIKALFLRKTLEDMTLKSVAEVVNARLEAIDRSNRFDAMTARAAGKITESLGAAAPLIAAGGPAFLWKGSRWRQEIEEDRGWEREWRLSEERALVDTTIVILKFMRL